SIRYDSTKASSITCSGIPLLSGQKRLPSFVAFTHCQIVFLYFELLCQRLRERLPPQNPHSNKQLKAYCRLNFSLFPGVTPCLRFPFRRLLISCALANISSEIIGS